MVLFLVRGGGFCWFVVVCRDDGCGDASDDNNDVTDGDEDREILEICGHSSATHNSPTSAATTVSSP